LQLVSMTVPSSSTTSETSITSQFTNRLWGLRNIQTPYGRSDGTLTWVRSLTFTLFRLMAESWTGVWWRTSLSPKKCSDSNSLAKSKRKLPSLGWLAACASILTNLTISHF
jgi:hypothetical protein